MGECLLEKIETLEDKHVHHDWVVDLAVTEKFDSQLLLHLGNANRDLDVAISKQAAVKADLRRNQKCRHLLQRSALTIIKAMKIHD